VSFAFLLGGGAGWGPANECGRWGGAHLAAATGRALARCVFPARVGVRVLCGLGPAVWCVQHCGLCLVADGLGPRLRTGTASQRSISIYLLVSLF
jgi:hypothetical protein